MSYFPDYIRFFQVWNHTFFEAIAHIHTGANMQREYYRPFTGLQQAASLARVEERKPSNLEQHFTRKANADAGRVLPILKIGDRFMDKAQDPDTDQEKLYRPLRSHRTTMQAYSGPPSQPIEEPHPSSCK